MTKEEFEKGYCKRSEISIDEYRDDYNLITMPCNCGDDTCEGWAAVDNREISIKAHKDLYM